MEVAGEVVPEVPVVVERPRVRDVREADDLPEARRRDEREREQEEQQVPQDRGQGEPARVARAEGAGAGSPAPALRPFLVGYDALNSVQIRSRRRVPFAETLFVSSFFSVAAGGNTIGLFMMLFGRTVLSTERLSADP